MWTTEQAWRQPEKASGHLTASPIFLATSLPQPLNASCTESDYTTCSRLAIPFTDVKERGERREVSPPPA